MKLRSPYFARALFLLAVPCLFLAGTDWAAAQTHNNFQQRNSQFSPGGSTGVFLEPDQVMGTALTNPDGSNSNFVSRLPSSLSSQFNTGFSQTLPGMDQQLNGSRATLPNNTFNTKFSPLNGDMSASPMWQSNFPMGRNFPLKMAPSSNLREPQMATSFQKNSSLNDYTAYDRWKSPKPAPDKFTDSYVFHTTDNSKQLQQVGRELSLQDINRYQFQGEFSNKPGLPITHAGGDEDQVTATNGQIMHSPKLFDFNPSLSNTVPSGNIVAPRIITSEGPRPYLPGTPTTSGTATKQSAQAMNNPPPASTPPPTPAATTTSRGEIPKNEAVLPQGKYQFTTPDGNKVPVEVDAPEVIIQQDN